MHSVEDVKRGNEVVEHYRVCFEKKYGIKPILKPGLDQTYCKDLVRRHGAAFTMELIEEYFSIDDQFFAKNAYSLTLLKDKENVVLVSLKRKKGTTGLRPNVASSGRGPKMNIRLWCDNPKCTNVIECDVYADEMGRRRFCPSCG